MGNWCLVIGQAKGKNSFYSLLTHYPLPIPNISHYPESPA